MGAKLTAEQLNELPKEALVTLVLSMQEQLDEMNGKLDHLIGQITLANSQRFGRHTEKLSQISGQGYIDADGQICFNEAEALADQSKENGEPDLEIVIRKHTPRPKGKKDADLSSFPVIVLPTVEVPEETIIREFGSLDNCRRMPDGSSATR